MTRVRSRPAAPAAEPAHPKALGEADLAWAARMESLALLTGGLSHALGNILAAVLLAVDLLSQSGGLDDRKRRLLASLKGVTQEGLDAVRQVLYLARGTSGEAIAFQPQLLLSELQKLAATTFPRRLRLVTRYPPDLSPLVGEPVRFLHLLIALCLDARRSLPGGGVIEVTARNSPPAATGGKEGSDSAREEEEGRGGRGLVVLEVVARAETGTSARSGGTGGGETRPRGKRGGEAGEGEKVAGGRARGAATAELEGPGFAAGWLGPAFEAWEGTAGGDLAMLATAAGGWIEEAGTGRGGGQRQRRPARRTVSAAPAGTIGRLEGAGFDRKGGRESGRKGPADAVSGWRVLLPAAAARSSAAVPEEAEPARGTGQRVRVAEEEPVLAEAMVRTLENHGYRAFSAGAPGAEADVVLVAAGLDSTGRPQWRGGRAVLLLDPATASRLESSASAMASGGPVLLRKPFSARQLLAAVAAALAEGRKAG